MTRLFILVIVLFAVGFVLNTFSSKKDKKEKPKAFQKLPYQKRPFLTASEHTLFKKLEEQYDKDHYVIPQVLLASIVDVAMPSHFYAYKGYRSKIDKKTLDFVLFDKASFAPVLAIELDDYTHERPDRKLRDEFVNTVLDKVGIKIERIKNT